MRLGDAMNKVCAASMRVQHRIIKKHFRGSYKKEAKREALKRAWGMIRQGEFTTKIVGSTFTPQGQWVMSHLKGQAGVPLILKLEYSNVADPDAVAVYVNLFDHERKVGYLTRDTLMPVFAELGILRGEVAQITGGEFPQKPNFGMNVRLFLQI